MNAIVPQMVGHNGGPPLVATSFNDAVTANLGFVVAQTAHVEAGVYRMKYPEYDYASLIPVDFSANPWIKSVTYFSLDAAGAAKFIAGNSADIPVVGFAQEKHETDVHMAAIGYDYGMEEINQARMLAMNLPNEKAIAARRGYERLTYETAFSGQTGFGWEGLFNNTSVPSETIPADGTGSSALWSTKTGDLILRDMNQMLTGMGSATNHVEMANTLILPIERLQYIATVRVGDTPMTVLEFFLKNNVYTAQTGQPIRIVGKRGMTTIGSGSTARMIAYRRAPDVLKMHVPMPHQFLPVQVRNLQFLVPGIFRLGGLDIRLPYAVRYGDGI